MHTPTPDPREDEEEPDVKHPPVPPDQEPYVVPQREPPNPDESHPLIGCSWRPFDPGQGLAVHDSRVLDSSTSLGHR
jgi:hypothetical protein